MIFLSYASEDRERVRPYYSLLEGHGLDPWMDCEKILGGQSWDYEIKTALERADIIVVFVSSNSVDKRGYAQREIKFAIERYEEKIIGDIFIIPIQLDAGEFPYVLKDIQFIRADQSNAEKELLRSLQTAQSKVDTATSFKTLDSELRWSLSEIKSQYNGIPGYSTRVDRISISSTKFAEITDVADNINGALADFAMEARQNALEPNPSLFNLMQDEWQRTNTFDAIFDGAEVVGRFLSLRYSLHWYYAGAVHPIHSPKTFNYLLEPVVKFAEVRQLFANESALLVLQSEAEKLLVELLYPSASSEADLNWIREGLSDWGSFRNFGLSEKGISISFSSYQVACYAAGTPEIVIPFAALLAHFSDGAVHGLGLYRQRS